MPLAELLTPQPLARSLTARRRQRVEMQGFSNLNDDYLTLVEPWLRLAPALCLLWAAIATVFESSWGLIALAPIALLGAVLKGHPFDLLYNHGIRKWTLTPRLPRYRAPRRFACWMASAWLIAAAWAFHAGLPGLGWALGSSLVAAAAVQVTSGFCIPSFLYRSLSGQRSDKPRELRSRGLCAETF